jgi:hypothetical protein
MSVAPLLLEQLEVGARVRADGDVIYVTEDLGIPDGAEGSVVRARVGWSFVRWDVVPGRVVATSNDSLARVEVR